ncbi:antibiotic biosynthesis monooxygenase [Nocardia vinacea]|uniref:Antibiotic biosynthesis monooxygenase n=1 Tax=Nocardia vinacea TaxID=96468 RepID=A0ABZ1YPF5_9NOCA|nr:antibiotic biosynthesis monooxygenase [Nocardia vinacea]
MISVIAQAILKDGKGPEFESIIARLVKQVAEHEPGNLTYRLVRSQTDPNDYRFFELYSDRVAFESHSRSEHFRSAWKLMTPLMASAPKIELFDTV